MRFDAAASGPPIAVDRVKEGTPAGPTPMEQLLISLAGCGAIDVVSTLAQRRQAVDALEIDGARRDGHPRIFERIEIVYAVAGEDLSEKAVENAIRFSRDRYCSLSAMLSELAVSHRYRIVDRAGATVGEGAVV